jgi:hypothetical protein
MSLSQSNQNPHLSNSHIARSTCNPEFALDLQGKTGLSFGFLPMPASYELYAITSVNLFRSLCEGTHMIPQEERAQGSNLCFTTYRNIRVGTDSSPQRKLLHQRHSLPHNAAPLAVFWSKVATKILRGFLRPSTKMPK